MYPTLSHLTAGALALTLAGCAGAAAVPGMPSAPGAYYSTKTPYQPQQDSASYEGAPAGYAPVFTQMVARHGSRGLSGAKYDVAMHNIWKRAAAENALTPLGAQLGPDIDQLMRATALMGYGVEGVSKPGYGNLSRLGIQEHQQLAQRMRARMATLFAQLEASAASAPRQIVVISSGVDRARDSAANFTRSLVSGSAPLARLVTEPAAPAPYPAGAPVAGLAGTDRFMLHFHSLKPATDKVTDPRDPRFQAYQDSQAYQAYEASPAYAAKLAAIGADADGKAAARAVLERLFAKSFVDRIDSGEYTFDNAGSYTFTSDDGKFTTTVKGNGKSRVKGLADAASMLYNLYVIAAGMKNELAADFTKYVPAAQARHLAYLQDLESFYKQGPSFTESNGVTWKMAHLLEYDFFDEVDAIDQGKLAHGAKLRFAHAETIIPFASRLAVKGVMPPLPMAQLYTYDNSAWRGAQVAPMAANVQWDVYRNEAGRLIVKMLYNEKETAFKPACDTARIAPASYFYDYRALKACYPRG
jgi:hypothetical protein